MFYSPLCGYEKDVMCSNYLQSTASSQLRTQGSEIIQLNRKLFDVKVGLNTFEYGFVVQRGYFVRVKFLKDYFPNYGTLAVNENQTTSDYSIESSFAKVQSQPSGTNQGFYFRNYIAPVGKYSSKKKNLKLLI